MAWNLISNTTIAGPLGGGTSGNISTIGANLIVWTHSCDNTHAVSLTDNQSNSYVQLNLKVDGGSIGNVRIHYCLNPITSATHNFTAGAGNGAPGDVISAWSGCKSSSPVDGQSAGGSNSSSATIQPGSLTPSQAGCLVITTVEQFGGTDGITGTIDGGFTAVAQVGWLTGQNFYNGQFYLVQGAAAAANPTYTHGVTPTCMAAISAAFLPGTGTPSARGFVFG